MSAEETPDWTLEEVVHFVAALLENMPNVKDVGTPDMSVEMRARFLEDCLLIVSGLLLSSNKIIDDLFVVDRELGDDDQPTSLSILISKLRNGEYLQMVSLMQNIESVFHEEE